MRFLKISSIVSIACIGYIIGQIVPYTTFFHSEWLQASQNNPQAALSDLQNDFYHLLTNKWETEMYNDPQLKSTNNSLTITGNSTSSGIYFRRSVNEKEKYKLKIVGKTHSTPVSLRLRIDDNEPQWLKAPNGNAIIPISKAKKVEVLIYSDTRFKYEISNFTLSTAAPI